MEQKTEHRQLTSDQIAVLNANGCTAEGDDWTRVRVATGFDATHVRNSFFGGEVRIGAHRSGHGLPAGVFNACLVNCTVGDNVRIANVGVRISGYDIADDASIEDVGLMETSPGACFGNGVEVEVLNEGGGREVLLLNEMSSQLAYLLCLHRHRPKFTERLMEMVRTAAGRVKADRGAVGRAAQIQSVAEIIDVRFGDHTVVRGAASLINGTILSSRDAPTAIGVGVQAKDFIVAEGSEVSGGAMLHRSFVGQGCQMGRQFSAESSVFFANCEGFHGEACNVFAGPYTVTHHKSTLLIAGFFSFYNAGSGTNQSNHMYKLGPLHEGKLERGSKTGSFSYMMWPCRVAPFSVVLGKHTRVFDSADLPFSMIEATPEGRPTLAPGFNLTTVGTVRDEAKWPTRDRRRGEILRDRICFDVFSPLTAGRMMRGIVVLQSLQQATDRSRDTVVHHGAVIKRVLLRTGQKYYRRAISMYLAERVVSQVETALADGAKSLTDCVAPSPDTVYSQDWVDVGGQLMPAGRLETLCEDVENGTIGDLAGLYQQLDRCYEAYRDDEWLWVRHAQRDILEVDLDRPDRERLCDVADVLLRTKKDFLELVLADATKEFAEPSRIGYGMDGDAECATADFRAVRGDYDENEFVKETRGQIESLSQRVERFKQILPTKS